MFARLNHIAAAGFLATTLTACATSTAPAAGASCDRACLSGAITTYMVALLTHDPSKLPLAETVKFTEDQVPVKVGESPLWKGATLPRDYRQDFIDVREGVAGSHIILEENGVPVMLVLRLKLVDKKITEIETQVTRNQTEGAIFNIDALTKASDGMAYTPKSNERMSRAALIRAAEFYPRGLQGGSFADAPFADDAYRLENGAVMAAPTAHGPTPARA